MGFMAISNPKTSTHESLFVHENTFLLIDRIKTSASQAKRSSNMAMEHALFIGDFPS